MNFKYSKPLGSDKSYKRPEITYQEQLSKEEIREKLQGYVKVNDISEVPTNTHMRYFIKGKDGKMVYRNGGFLVNKNNADIYIMMSNGKDTWSVQTQGAVFYRKMSHKEEIDGLRHQYEKKIKEQNEVINDLKSQVVSSDPSLSVELVDNDKKKKVKSKNK